MKRKQDTAAMTPAEREAIQGTEMRAQIGRCSTSTWRASSRLKRRVRIWSIPICTTPCV